MALQPQPHVFIAWGTTSPLAVYGILYDRA